MDSLLNIEEHPLEPFLPANAVLLMLGSFPPVTILFSALTRIATQHIFAP